MFKGGPVLRYVAGSARDALIESMRSFWGGHERVSSSPSYDATEQAEGVSYGIFQG
jgi:hypothetical protein